MNEMEFEKMTSEEMSQIKGGIWVRREDGKWIWIEVHRQEEDDF